MKIDVYTHWWPRKAAQALQAKARPGSNTASLDYLGRRETRTAVNDLDLRFRFMDRHPDLLHVLTISNPPVEVFADPADAAEISRMANDELAGLVADYPDRFVAAAAILPMNDMELALAECDRAIGELGLSGIRLYTTILGETLDSERLRPLYARMAEYDLPIWLHPTDPVEHAVGQELLLGWEYETSKAMLRIASSWVFDEFPDLKFITHHLGAMIPTFEQRIRWLARERKTHANLKRFYNDTALYGCTPALMCGHAFFGTEKILFGTDMPLGTKRVPHAAGFVETTLAAVEAMAIPEADKRKILFDNAVRLLRLAV